MDVGRATRKMMDFFLFLIVLLLTVCFSKKRLYMILARAIIYSYTTKRPKKRPYASCVPPSKKRLRTVDRGEDDSVRPDLERVGEAAQRGLRKSTGAGVKTGGQKRGK